jgi:hypothetical protein
MASSRVTAVAPSFLQAITIFFSFFHLDSIPLISVPTPLDCEDLIILQEFGMLVEAAMVSNLQRVTPLPIP